ncbi:YcxB family protein [Kitasatospora viridis]|uniref:YcxB-like protein n=1 Tax=Kitasatospora viridis TaxID=281105 RepID=A0A561SEB6_9ACTN|nr:YcxB family protein [Kitasatospora viridis]TWF73201.1 hypothetical protein FHX73_16352 [Kitasatospora viridis]
MDIQVSYQATTEEIVAVVAANAATRPGLRWGIVGLWAVLAVVCAAAGSLWFAVAAFFFGFVQVLNITATGKRMGAKVAPRYVGATTARLTDEVLQLNSPVQTREIPWSAVSKVTHTPMAWSVLSQKLGSTPQSAIVLKAAFSAEQRAEVDAFLAALPKVAHKGRAEGLPTGATKTPVG